MESPRASDQVYLRVKEVRPSTMTNRGFPNELSVEALGQPRPCPNLSLGKSGDCHSSPFFSLSPKEFTFHAQIVLVLSVKGVGYESRAKEDGGDVSPPPPLLLLPFQRLFPSHFQFRSRVLEEKAAAAGLSYVGAYVINTYKSYDNFLQDKYALLPAVIIICVAVVMFIIGLIGCCATFRESRVGLGLFLAIILVIFIAEVSAFVLGFVYREKVKTDVQGTMRSVFEKYDGKNPESTVVDYLQEHLHCCGVKNYSDWTTTQWFNSTGNNRVPLSCCQQEAKNCTGHLDQPQELNRQGCAQELESGLQNVISYAMLVILGFAIVKFFGMLSVCVLTCKKEESGYQPLYS
ncbi:hypothetical protein IHE44_0011744, partial [Lamprotornis superbus]